MKRGPHGFFNPLAVWARVTLSVSGRAAAIVGLGVVCCAPPAAAAAAISHGTDGPADTTVTTATIEVPEVECATCDLKVRMAIKGAGGVRRLNEGDPKNRIIVTYEPGAGRPDAYVEALHKAGFAKAHVVA